MVLDVLFGPHLIVPEKTLYTVERDVIASRALEAMTESEFRARYGSPVN